MGYGRIKFQGYSMYPALRPGDTLVLDIVSASDCSPGDIVCVAGGDGYTVHRIIEIDRDPSCLRITTKGDSLTYCDPPVAFPPEGIPRVVMISRGGRRLIRPRLGKAAALLSRRNLTVGVIRGKVACFVRAACRRLSTLFRQEIPKHDEPN